MSEPTLAGRAPGERGSPRARFTAASVGAGVLAAMLLPRAPVGLGFVVVAVALAGAAALAGRPARPLRSALLGALALALAASAGLRDAGWVVGVELVAAVALGSLAMSAPRTWRGSIRGALAAPLRMASGARLIAAGAVRAVPRGSRGQAFALGRGLLLTGVLLTIFGALFATGDRAFAQIAGEVLPDEVPLGDLPLRLLVLGLVVSLAGGLAQAAAIPDAPARGPRLRLGRAEWPLALGALNVLFVLFVAVQIAVLFGGDDHVRDSAGLTYAEYARSGFAQLVGVAGLTLAVVAGALRWARAESVAQARLLRALLCALCVLTLVVLASALHRLGLYEQAYGFTRTRLACARAVAVRRRAVRARGRGAGDRPAGLAGAGDRAAGRGGGAALLDQRPRPADRGAQRRALRGDRPGRHGLPVTAERRRDRAAHGAARAAARTGGRASAGAPRRRARWSRRRERLPLARP